jgi:hypothetical protein
VELKPALLAWLAFWAETALSGAPLRHWRDHRFGRIFTPLRRLTLPEDAIVLQH